MKDFSEIKKEYEDKCYSIKDLKMSIFAFKLIRFLLSELFFFIISLIPFLVGWCIIISLYGYSIYVTIFYLTIHLLYYIFYVKKLYNKDILPNFTEVNLIIEALRQIKIEKNKK